MAAKELGSGQRTYVLGVSGALSPKVDLVVDIPFTDTAGNVIRCNYCSIQLGSTVSVSHTTGVILELSGLSRQGDMTTNDIKVFQDDGALQGSGILGIGVCGAAGESKQVEWHGANGEVATGAKMKVLSEHDVYHVFITYGNLYPLNNLRLEQSYDRGV